MQNFLFIIKLSFITFFCVVNLAGCRSRYFSPVALSADPSHQRLYIAGSASNEVVALNLDHERIEKTWTNIPSPSGLALLADGSKLFVTCATPEGFVTVIDIANGKKLPDLPAGHTPMSPIVSPDGRFLYICNRFNNDVWLIDIEKKAVAAKVPVMREPLAMTLDKSGRFLFVANHLPFEPANTGNVAAAVSVIDVQENKVIKHIRLPDGSTSLRGICISPDDRYVFVTHILAHYQLPTIQLERGWMNTNALSVIDAKTKKLYATVLLDDVDRGAANPWAVACSPDGQYICVTHAGTQEMSVIDARKLFEKLQRREQLAQLTDQGNAENGYDTVAVDISYDLTFLTDIRRRIPLPGAGPRSMAMIGRQVFIGEYFSDQVALFEFDSEEPARGKEMLSLSNAGIDAVRQGEIFFNDASFCFQSWQSCASCHPDGRADGLNWDLLNDGVGNPKNTKSLLLSMQTPPAMITGIRDHPEEAVRSGLKFILFSVRSEKEAANIDAYLDALKPIPSPYLEEGKLSKSANHGKKYYVQAGCVSCHPKPLFTNMKNYDVGTGMESEKNRVFDTPSLVEVWRTSPYLVDGQALTMQEVLINCNRENKHGNVVDLNQREINYLLEYILSL
jgi:YVTN family beta-propeller protein